MRFPLTVRHRKAEAVVYGKTARYRRYRVAYRAGGKRMLRSFGTFSEALKEANKRVREMAAGSHAVELSGREVSMALSIREAATAFRRDTGKEVNPALVLVDALDCMKRLGEMPLRAAVDGFLRSVAVLRRRPLAEAVKEFLASREPKTHAKDGKRPALDPKYHANVSAWLNEFVGAFPGHDVADLSKDRINLFFGEFAELSAKSRNDRRAALRMFLAWCVRNDYLSATHRLGEADGLAREASDAAPIDFYRPGELQSMLDGSEGVLRAVIALQGLAGLRLEEVHRLSWGDVWRVPGHIEVSSAKSKTRQRRLVEIVPALERWLAPFRQMEGPVWQWQTLNGFVQAAIALRKKLEIPSRRNGLRHAFVTCHLALRGNENLTSAAAGNSPAMIHAHYRGLATKAEALKWFAVVPSGTAENIVPLREAAEGGPK